MLLSPTYLTLYIITACRPRKEHSLQFGPPTYCCTRFYFLGLYSQYADNQGYGIYQT